MTINYSLGSRNMAVAGRLCAKAAYPSYQSKYLIGKRWTLFDQFQSVHEPEPVRKMEKVTREMVMTYANHLLARHQQGEIARITMKCYLSAVNMVLWLASGDKERIVHFGRDLGLPREPRKTLFNRGDRYCEALCASLPPRVFAMTNLQREFGLRFEESAKFNAREALREARETGQVTISKGTKGGKLRVVSIRNESQQLSVLYAASEFQGDHKSMIPRELTYKTFHSRAYGAAYRRGVRFHDARHAYAQATYQKLTSWPPPISLILSKKEHKKFVIKEYGVSESHFIKYDRYARRTISKELGHERVQVSTTYLG